MDYDTNTTVHSRVINAFFDTDAAAKAAVDDLIAAGIPEQHITRTGGTTAGTVATHETDDKGFWDSLKDLFLPDDDRDAYAEGLRRGGYLVSVRADEANYNRVLEILDKDGSVNMDERESQWRSEGWSATRATALEAGSSAALGTTTSTATRAAAIPTATRTTETQTTTRSDAALGARSVEAGKDEVIPVYEEQLRVGKRDVNHGRVRLRSYVVETPVNEQVSLRNETVTIDRRPVDRAVNAADALFQERTIEVEEHAEEAIIAKEARVKEEISLRKTAEDRVQTVNDTVRRTEVEIDDTRGKTTTTGATTSATATRFSAATDAASIVEHMDVISADGQKIGTVDHLDGPDRIKLAKNTSPDGQHHYVPLAWIDHVDQHVHLKANAAEVKAGW